MSTTWPLTAREQRLLDTVRELIPRHVIEVEPAQGHDDGSAQLSFSIDNLHSIGLRRDAIAKIPNLDSLVRLVVLELNQSVHNRTKQAR